MIYFIQEEHPQGRIKVGYTSSKNAKSRLSGNQTGNPNRLVLLGTIAGSRNKEAFIHSQLSAHNAHGEWFEPSDYVVDIVQAYLGDKVKFAHDFEGYATQEPAKGKIKIAHRARSRRVHRTKKRLFNLYSRIEGGYDSLLLMIHIWRVVLAALGLLCFTLAYAADDFYAVLVFLALVFFVGVIIMSVMIKRTVTNRFKMLEVEG